MTEATLADLRSPTKLQKWRDVVSLEDARKKHSVGYFVPAELKDVFEPFLQEYERQKKMDLLQRVAAAQKADPIDDGALADGIEPVGLN